MLQIWLGCSVNIFPFVGAPPGPQLSDSEKLSCPLVFAKLIVSPSSTAELLGFDRVIARVDFEEPTDCGGKPNAAGLMESGS